MFGEYQNYTLNMYLNQDMSICYPYSDLHYRTETISLTYYGKEISQNEIFNINFLMYFYFIVVKYIT